MHPFQVYSSVLSSIFTICTVYSIYTGKHHCDLILGHFYPPGKESLTG